MLFQRSAGILLHPTSLPGRFGIGDLGAAAYNFVDFLARSGQSIWQVMPLGPTGYGDSPYQCFSAVAGNTLLVSPEKLLADGYLDTLDNTSKFPEGHVDYGAVIHDKSELLRRSFVYFQSYGRAGQRQAFDAFRQANGSWLDDYALFMALKKHYHGAVWSTWDADVARREPGAIKEWAGRLAESVLMEQYCQFLFFEQWRQLRHYVHEKGLRIVGDAPIFVAYDSADAWAHPDMFYFDAERRPTCVAGVPPDYFSLTGQLWGNPLYRWDWMAADGFHWWIERMRGILSLVDMVRLDHFRGFEAYWEVPAGEQTAVNGRWVKGPGKALFTALKQALGDLPIIAEDLGVITPEVEALRDGLGFPGMKVLQFAFGSGAENPYLPHNYLPNCVVYTGTHDNDTTIGWFATRPPEERRAIQEYLARDGRDIAWDLMRLAHGSTAALAVVPLQDVLRLGGEARMNTPGRAGGNWQWRYRAGVLTDRVAHDLAEMTRIYGRTNQAVNPKSDRLATSI
jgi:4-alpha-glucanotransferase